MFGFGELLFILTLLTYGLALVFDLPYRFGISKFASLVFFALFFLTAFLWPQPEALLQSDWYMYLGGGVLLLDPAWNKLIFQLLIGGTGFCLFLISFSTRKFPGPALAVARPPAEVAAGGAKPLGRGAVRHGDYAQVRYKDITVCYTWALNGGGLIFAPEFVRVVGRKIGRVGHVFEYCAGPGFIGFSLLAHNLCDRLTLADINPEAVEALRETVRRNHLQDRVTVYQSDCLDAIPAGEQWDLVVSNPPWRLAREDTGNLRVCDPGSRVHEKFYRDVRQYLKPGGSVLSVEGAEFTDVNCFREMIAAGGLSVAEVFRAVSFWGIGKDLREYSGLTAPQAVFLRLCLFVREAYFIWSQRKE